MRVVVLNTLFDPHIAGGAEIMAREVAGGLLGRGHELTVLTTCGARPGTVERDNVGGIPVLRLGQRNAYWHFPRASRPAALRALWHARDMHNAGMARELAAQLAALRPDVVMTHNLAGFSASAWDAAAQAGVPVVHVLHDPYLLCPRSTMFRHGSACVGQCLSCRALRLGHARRSRTVTAVIGVSRYILDLHLARGYFDSARVRRVIHNARRLASVPPSAAAPTPQDGPVRLGFLGTLSVPKGLLLLLAAFRALCAGRPGGCELRVAGTGSGALLEQARQLAAGLPVSFLGHVAAERFLPQIDALVVPSLWNDTFPSVVFEAFACGVPVVGSRRGGIPEMIVDGENGLLFDPEREDALAGALGAVLEPRLRMRLAEGALRSGRCYADPDAMLDGYEEVLWQACRLAAAPAPAQGQSP